MNTKRFRTMRVLALCGGALALLGGSGGTASADTFTVTNLADSGEGSLRRAIQDANGNSGADIVDATGVEGTILLESRLPNPGGNQHLLILGPGPDRLTVSGQDSTRLFQVVNNGSSLEIDGVTLAHGRAGSGGSSADGGAMLVRVPVTLTNCVVRDNTCDDEGGAIKLESSGRLSATNTVFSNNRAIGRHGGAVFAFAGNNLQSFIDCTFTGNNAGRDGGAISTFGTPARFRGCTFEANVADAGGALDSGGRFDIANCTFSANRTRPGGGHRGGAISCSSRTVIRNSTFFANSAQGEGGAIYADCPDGVSIGNSIFDGNTAQDGGPNIFGTVDSNGHNLVSNPNGAMGLVASDILNVSANLGPLQDNGGPTLTYALLPDSPALDAGSVNNAVDPFDSSSLLTDQRGVPRIAIAVDLGAVEYQWPCIDGNVNAGLGPAVPVLKVNGATGSVTVLAGEAFTLDLAASPAGPATGEYLVFAWAGPASGDFPLFGNVEIGCFANPTPLNLFSNPQPARCIRSAGIPEVLCFGVAEASFAPESAPWSLNLSRGFDTPGVYTLQCLLQDDGSPSGLGYSVTNFIQLTIE